MAIIKCKMCGGDMELSADQTYGTCEYCGSTMTLPKVNDEQRAATFKFTCSVGEATYREEVTLYE